VVALIVVRIPPCGFRSPLADPAVMLLFALWWSLGDRCIMVSDRGWALPSGTRTAGDAARSRVARPRSERSRPNLCDEVVEGFRLIMIAVSVSFFWW